MRIDLTEPSARTRDRIERAVARARGLNRPVLVSSSVELVPPEDLLVLVEKARAGGADTVLWERCTEGLAIAGIGVASTLIAHGPDRFRAIAAASKALLRDAVIDHDPGDTTAGPIFLGGFAFAPEMREDGRWRGFPAGRLVLPRVLIVRRDNAATLTLNTMVDPGSEVDAICQQLAREVSLLQDTAAPVMSPTTGNNGASRYETKLMPADGRWKEAVAAAISDIDAGRLEKLVLARECSITSSNEFDCAAVVRRLRHAYPSCATFWIGTADGSFLGATPEPLVRLSGRTVSTAAIAASIARGTSPASDRLLARELLESTKDKHEHALVVRAMMAALQQLCEELEVASVPEVLPLANVQHLMTTIRGRLAGPHHVLDLVDRLHPTPAVAGYPRAAALVEMQAREPLDRGWYAGPVGWMNARGEGEFAVAIRSALVKGREAALYAGAGIVAGSDPEAELAETHLKLQPLLSALTES